MPLDSRTGQILSTGGLIALTLGSLLGGLAIVVHVLRKFQLRLGLKLELRGDHHRDPHAREAEGQGSAARLPTENDDLDVSLPNRRQ